MDTVTRRSPIAVDDRDERDGAAWVDDVRLVGRLER